MDYLEFSGICKTLTRVGVALLTIWIFQKIYGLYKNNQEKLLFTNLRKRKQAERKIQFEELRKKYPLTQTEEEIVALSFKELQEKLQARTLKAETVLKAFLAKSMKVQDEFNCITEYVPKTIDKAKELDILDKPKGPLHGIPFCVKDDTNVKGMDSTSGCSRLLYKPAKESAAIVQTLENLGAIAFCRGNVPQTCLSIGSENPIFGKTLNPVKKELGPGGSSSGSACIVAAGGCPFATGTDSGGSLRIPAHTCGISTLRTTYNRISDDGTLHCSPGLTTVAGILIKRSEDLAFIYEAMISEQVKNPLDYKVPPIPWNSEMFNSPKKLRIGYFTSISVLPPIGDTESVVLNAKSFLEKEGHTLIPFEMPDHRKSWTSQFLDDGMPKDFLKLTKNDEISPCIKSLSTIFYIFPIYISMFGIAAKICKLFGLAMPGLGKDFEWPMDRSIEKEKFGVEILRKMKELNVELLLSPAYPHPAIGVEDFGSSIKNQYVTIYNYLWNMVNFPAGVVKFGEESGKNWETTDISDHRVRDKSFGMPIGVQIIGKPYQEEQVLRILAELGKK